ncbi:hypothetical protein QMA77_05375 [Pantoea ananatis]|uniref:hypothetical protein n=1 Tax=Pantoea ananas TaxID=553 RepID=UPI0024AD9051|nr:hypothetical protein [Pantoea ananatis]MDI6536368.1 hypothetical protein [Pantoea ananatis]
MPLYKFISKKYHDEFFRSGSLRLGTIHDFKDIIKHNLGRGDTNEGRHYLSRDFNEMQSFKNVSSEPILRELFDFPDNVTLDIGMLTILSERVSADGFIFCSSGVFDLEIFKRWNADYPEIDYCYEISEPEGFFEKITNKIKSSAFFIGANYIDYAPDPIPYDSKSAGVYPAFTKEEKEFSWQREHRVMWAPLGPCLMIKPWVIEVPEARKFCRPFAALENGKIVAIK